MNQARQPVARQVSTVIDGPVTISPLVISPARDSIGGKAHMSAIWPRRGSARYPRLD